MYSDYHSLYLSLNCTMTQNWFTGGGGKERAWGEGKMSFKYHKDPAVVKISFGVTRMYPFPPSHEGVRMKP